jgi:hypothetical protein
VLGFAHDLEGESLGPEPGLAIESCALKPAGEVKSLLFAGERGFALRNTAGPADDAPAPQQSHPFS